MIGSACRALDAVELCNDLASWRGRDTAGDGLVAGHEGLYELVETGTDAGSLRSGLAIGYPRLTRADLLVRVLPIGQCITNLFSGTRLRGQHRNADILTGLDVIRIVQ